jgi:hypothetical protein
MPVFRVVAVDVQVAVAVNVQVDQPVASNDRACGQKPMPVDSAASGAVQIQLDDDFGFCSVAGHLGPALGAFRG